jgi:hypothetical protein
MKWTIHKLYNQFNIDSSVVERKSRQPLPVHSLENIDALRGAAKKPQQITRKAAAQLGISRRSVQGILICDLNLYPHTK